MCVLANYEKNAVSVECIAAIWNAEDRNAKKKRGVSTRSMIEKILLVDNHLVSLKDCEDQSDIKTIMSKQNIKTPFHIP